MSDLVTLLWLRSRLLLRSSGSRGGRPALVGRSLTRPLYLLLILGFLGWTVYRLATAWVSSQGEVARLIEAALLQPVLTNLASIVSIVIFFYAFNSLIDTFTDKSDLRLLLISPLSPTLILTEKLLMVSLRFTGILLLAVPALYALGNGLNVSALYVPAVLISLLLFPLAPVGVAALVLLALLRVLPPARAKSVSSVLGTVLGIILLLGSRLAFSTVTAAPQLPSWLPTVWPGRFLIATALGNTREALQYALLTLLLGVGAISLAVGAAVNVFTTGWATYGEVGRRKGTRFAANQPTDEPPNSRAMPADTPVAPHATRERPQSWVPLLHKEWLTMRRDTQWLMSFVYPLLIVGFNAWRVLGQGRGQLAQIGDTVTLLLLLACSMLLVGSTVPPLVNAEGRAIHLLALSPLTPRAIVQTKWLFGALPAAVIINVALVGLTLYVKLPWGEALFEAAVLTLLTITLSGVSLMINLIWPKRESSVSKRSASGMAAIATLVAEAVLCLGTGVLLGVVLHVWHGSAAIAGGIGLIAALLLIDLVTFQAAPWLMSRLMWSERGLA